MPTHSDISNPPRGRGHRQYRLKTLMMGVALAAAACWSLTVPGVAELEIGAVFVAIAAIGLFSTLMGLGGIGFGAAAIGTKTVRGWRRALRRDEKPKNETGSHHDACKTG